MSEMETQIVGFLMGGLMHFLLKLLIETMNPILRIIC